jgi:hypothetical protein
LKFFKGRSTNDQKPGRNAQILDHKGNTNNHHFKVRHHSC